MSFSESRLKWKNEYSNKNYLERSIVTVDGNWIEKINLRRENNEFNEEYYKWEFIYSIIDSGLFSKDYIGTEIYFPKGNINSAPIKIDAVIFNNKNWIDDYKLYRDKKDQSALDRLRKNAIVMIEFKDEDNKRIEQVFNSQIKATIKESDSNFTLGIYYNFGRLYLFKKVDGVISRYDNGKNFEKSQRILEQYQLEITDPYYLIPSYSELEKKILGVDIKGGNLKVNDLDIIDRISDKNLSDSLNKILRQLTEDSLFNEEGYILLIQLLSLKIYDEHRSDKYGQDLDFFISENELMVNSDISAEEVQAFITRLKNIFDLAKKQYINILSEHSIDWKNPRKIRVSQVIVKEFQKYSFTRSEKSDLYQLVFYNFATKFKKAENAQFLTPIPIIDFIVKLINPKRDESVCDPCCGISDFLSVSYVNSNFKLNDSNLFGIDNDHNMTILAQLNMLLNGDGNANIFWASDKGSIDQKLSIEKKLVKLNPKYHESGNWDNWVDQTELMKYDIILTNPPFGKGRSLNLSSAEDIRVAKFYETYDRYIETNPKDGLDLGVVFLENAVRSIKDGGRFGIIISNSIASNKNFEFVREWLLEKVRLVALFDLPSNIFAETGVNTTIIIGYKPKNQYSLKKLIKSDYEIFTSEIDNVGYTKRTSDRNVIFEKNYKLDLETFETVIDPTTGDQVLNEDFSENIKKFKDWCLFQEEELKELFLD